MVDELLGASVAVVAAAALALLWALHSSYGLRRLVERAAEEEALQAD